MRKYLVLFSALMLLLGLSGVAGAYSITYTYNSNGFNELISPISGYLTEDFNDAVLLWSISGNWNLVSNSAVGFYAAPAFSTTVKDPTQYLTVPKDYIASRSATIDFGSEYNYFGLWWGSIDATADYNKLMFYRGTDLVLTVNGYDVINPNNLTGDQNDPETNKYVNIYFGSDRFDSLTIVSNQYACEVDNITVGVPEPATMLLLGFGLFGLAGISRKLKK